MQNPIVAASTRMSGRPSKVTTIGRTGTSVDTSKRVPQIASRSPGGPAGDRDERLSVRSCRTIRQRLPPIASRNAISLRRAVPRASSMFARLRHEMSSTSPAIPISRAETAPVPVSVLGLVLTESRGSF